MDWVLQAPPAADWELFQAQPPQVVGSSNRFGGFRGVCVGAGLPSHDGILHVAFPRHQLAAGVLARQEA